MRSGRRDREKSSERKVFVLPSKTWDGKGKIKDFT